MIDHPQSTKLVILHCQLVQCQKNKQMLLHILCLPLSLYLRFLSLFDTCVPSSLKGPPGPAPRVKPGKAGRPGKPGLGTGAPPKKLEMGENRSPRAASSCPSVDWCCSRTQNVKTIARNLNFIFCLFWSNYCRFVTQKGTLKDWCNCRSSCVVLYPLQLICCVLLCWF